MKAKMIFATLCSAAVFSASPRAIAVPVMNENAAVSGKITIFPDHADPALFYVAPNVLSVCLTGDGTPRFSYQDVSSGFSKHGIAQMTVCANYTQTDIEASKTELLAKNAKARFVALPFLRSRIVFNPVLKPFIETQFCDHIAGMVGDEQACSFRLNSRGRDIFLKQVRAQVAMTMQYEYTVEGFIKLPDGKLDAQRTEYGVAVRIGGEEFKAHPELFLDGRGRPIRFKD